MTTLHKAFFAISETCITIPFLWGADYSFPPQHLPLVIVDKLGRSEDSIQQTNLLIFIGCKVIFSWFPKPAPPESVHKHWWRAAAAHSSLQRPTWWGLYPLPPPQSQPSPEHHSTGGYTQYVNQFPLKRCSKQELGTNQCFFTVCVVSYQAYPEFKKKKGINSLWANLQENYFEQERAAFILTYS